MTEAAAAASWRAASLSRRDSLQGMEAAHSSSVSCTTCTARCATWGGAAADTWGGMNGTSEGGNGVGVGYWHTVLPHGLLLHTVLHSPHVLQVSRQLLVIHLVEGGDLAPLPAHTGSRGAVHDSTRSGPIPWSNSMK